MDYTVSVFKKNSDKTLFEGKATQQGVLEILKRLSSLKGHKTADFMHELRESGHSHILEENNLPYEIIVIRE